MLLGYYQNAARSANTSQPYEEAETLPQNSAAPDRISYTLQRIIYPVQVTMVAAADAIGSFIYGVTHAQALKLRVDELESTNERLRAYRDRVERLESEVTRLKDLLALPKPKSRTAIACQIVGFFPSEHRLMLNVGRSSGVRPGSPVVAASGLVGQVVEAGPKNSFVNLITNPEFAVGARVVRISQEAGIANGQGGSQLTLTIYNERADVQVGDLITTSGLSDVYPEGIEVGRVTWLDTDKNRGVRRALVLPSVNLAKIRQVVVLSK